jgi:hypothetical protein
MKSLVLSVILTLQPAVADAQGAMSATYDGVCMRQGFADARVEFVIKQEILSEPSARLNSHPAQNLVIDGNDISFDAEGLWKHGTVSVIRHFEGQFQDNRRRITGTYSQHTGGTKEAKCDWRIKQ